MSVIATAAAQAGSPPVTFTDTFTDTETVTDVFVPCQEEPEPYTFTLNARGVFHVTAAAIDEEDNFVAPYHVTNTVTGTVVAVPSDGTGPTFTGRFTQHVGFTVFSSHSTETVTFSVRATGSDGSRVSFHSVLHFTFNPLGVEFSFEKARC